jgi:putative component of toxin-antitoxin plasmid stabilization module
LTSCLFANLRIDWREMPRSRVVLYCEEDGSVPFLKWFRGLPTHARDKVLVRIERDGIYELRATTRGVHYRVLYFFHKQVAAVVAHGVVKEAAVPDRDIDLAIRRKILFETNPVKHT